MPDTCAVIIGSGFPGLAGDETVATPVTRFGAPSAPVRTGLIGGKNVLTLSRHGDAHTIPPHAINYRANLVALRDAGATSIVSLNTVGVITAIRDSGDLAVPDQLLDYTWGRAHTIYDGEDGVVEHIEFTEPLSAGLRAELLAAAAVADIDCYDGGVYATTQGPRLESAAEIDRLERDGADYVGMTAMPEAALACELGLEYACLAMIVNKAAGRGDAPIHSDVEASTATARSRAQSVLDVFYSGRAQ